MSKYYELIAKISEFLDNEKPFDTVEVSVIRNKVPETIRFFKVNKKNRG